MKSRSDTNNPTPKRNLLFFCTQMIDRIGETLLRWVVGTVKEFWI